MAHTELPNSSCHTYKTSAVEFVHCNQAVKVFCIILPKRGHLANGQWTHCDKESAGYVLIYAIFYCQDSTINLN